MIHTSKQSKRHFLFWANFNLRNKNIKVLLFILVLGIILFLHFTGVLVMTATHSHII